MMKLRGYKAFDDDKHTALSQIQMNFLYMKTREFNRPFIKRGFMTDRNSLVGRSDFLDFILYYTNELTKKSCNVAAGFSNIACLTSKFHCHDGKTAYSWREGVIMTIMDVFCIDDGQESLKSAQDEHKTLMQWVYKKGWIAGKIRRLNWCPGFVIFPRD